MPYVTRGHDDFKCPFRGLRHECVVFQLLCSGNILIKPGPQTIGVYNKHDRTEHMTLFTRSTAMSKARNKRRKVDLSDFTAYGPMGVFPTLSKAPPFSSTPPSSVFNHIQIDAEGACKPSTSRTYLHAPPSPTKRNSRVFIQPRWNEEPDVNIDDLLTPAQQDGSLDESDITQLSETKRRHWRSVILEPFFMFSFTDMSAFRTNPYCTGQTNIAICTSKN